MPTHSVVDVSNDEQDSLDVFGQQIALIYGLIDGNDGDAAAIQLTLVGQTLGHITTETVVIIYYDSINFRVVEDDANHIQEFISRLLCALECAAEIILNLFVVIFAISVARIQLRVNRIIALKLLLRRHSCPSRRFALTTRRKGLSFADNLVNAYILFSLNHYYSVY